MGKFYKWLWFNTEFWLKPEVRRPYTFIMRDLYHGNPLLTITGLAVLFYCLGRWWWQVSLAIFLVGVISFLLGILFGHLFWGRKYVPGQQEKPTYLGD